MLKEKIQVIITGLIIYVIYIAGFHYYFEPIDYDIFFYCAAVFYGMSFTVWIYLLEYHSESQAQKLLKKHNYKSSPKSIKYKSNTAYTCASIIAIIVLLLSITPLLVSILLNQHDIYHIGWFYQTFIFFVGAAITYIIPFTYEIGETHSLKLGKHPHINNLGGKNSTGSSSGGSIDMNTWFNSWKEAGDVIPSPRVSEDTMHLIKQASSVFHKKSWVSQEEYHEAIKLVDKILIDTLKVNANTITYDASLAKDLGATENDQKNIDNIIYQRLENDYNFITFCEKHDFKYIKYNISNTTDKFIINTLEQREYASYLQNPSNFKKPPRTPNTPIWDIVHTVGDWYDIVADVIHYHYHPTSICEDISFSHKKSWISQKEYIDAVSLVNFFLTEILYIDKHELSPNTHLIHHLGADQDDMRNIDNFIYQYLTDNYNLRSFCEKTDFARARISQITDKYTNNALEQYLYALYLKNPSGYTSPPKEPTTPIWDIVHTVGDWYDIVADVIHYYYHPVYRADS